jgi:hypothetical protein
MNTVKRQLKTTYFPFRSCCNLSFTCKECCTQCTTHSHLSHTKVKLCITFVPFNCMTLCWGIVSRHTETISYLHIPGCPRDYMFVLWLWYSLFVLWPGDIMCLSHDLHSLFLFSNSCLSSDFIVWFTLVLWFWYSAFIFCLDPRGQPGICK